MQVSVVNQYGRYLDDPHRSRVIEAYTHGKDHAELSGGLAEIVGVETAAHTTTIKVEIAALEGE